MQYLCASATACTAASAAKLLSKVQLDQHSPNASHFGVRYGHITPVLFGFYGATGLVWSLGMLLCARRSGGGLVSCVAAVYGVTARTSG